MYTQYYKFIFKIISNSKKSTDNLIFGFFNVNNLYIITQKVDWFYTIINNDFKYKFTFPEFILNFRNIFIKTSIFIKKFLLSYMTPANLNYFWNTGSLLLVFLIIQILTGVLLACWYIPHIEFAFDSVEYIMREVRYGWLLRYIHANGASFFFGIMFIHILKNIYYGSYLYPRQIVWYTGVILYILSMGTAFLGYILPWGQMSYWAATVITSLLSAVPIIGDNILLFVWGSLSVSQPTLSRVFALHFVLPFVIAALAILHLTLLHQVGSNNPTGIKSKDLISFFPNYLSKDLLGIIFIFFLFTIFIFFLPNYLLHPDNYIKANPEVTPAHIVPEWYFLLFYGILRSIPSKVGGILLVILALFCLFIFPVISRPLTRSNRFKPLHSFFFWFFLINCILLSWTACNDISTPYYEIGQTCTIFFFLYFLFFNPLCDIYEKFIYSMLVEGLSLDSSVINKWKINLNFLNKEIKSNILIPKSRGNNKGPFDNRKINYEKSIKNKV